MAPSSGVSFVAARIATTVPMPTPARTNVTNNERNDAKPSTLPDSTCVR